MSARLAQFFLLATLAGASLVALRVVILTGSTHPEPAVQGRPADAALPVFPAAVVSPRGRPVYPYSVIPGGISDARELREAVAKDRVLAAHYQGFDLSRARMMRLKAARAVYVSYRLRNEIFWTRRPVTLRAGEEIITDGRHLARARCGNRLTAAPPQPTSPSEPPADTIDTPQRLVTTSLLETATPLDLSVTPPPQSTPERIETGSHRSGIYPVVPIGILIPTGGGGGKRPCDPNTEPRNGDCHPPKPSATPEPGTLVLITSGAVFLAGRRMLRART